MAPFRLSRCLNLALNLPEDSVDYFAKPTPLPPLTYVLENGEFMLCELYPPPKMEKQQVPNKHGNR